MGQESEKVIDLVRLQIDDVYAGGRVDRALAISEQVEPQGGAQRRRS